MKFLFLLFISATLSFHTNAHQYFFGFAELMFQAEESRFEGTLVLSTHDLEEWLRSRGLDIDEMELHEDDQEMLLLMESELFNGFKIENNGETIPLQSIGYEVLESGVTQFYFHSVKTAKPKAFDITFDLLMDKYPKQQNKVTYRDGKESYTAVFLPNKTQSSIILR